MTFVRRSRGVTLQDELDRLWEHEASNERSLFPPTPSPGAPPLRPGDKHHNAPAASLDDMPAAGAMVPHKEGRQDG